MYYLLISLILHILQDHKINLHSPNAVGITPHGIDGSESNERGESDVYSIALCTWSELGIDQELVGSWPPPTGLGTSQIICSNS
jgi:hypothetical protein